MKTAIIGSATSILTLIIGYLFTKRKTKIENNKIEDERIEAMLDFYKKEINYLKTIVSELRDEITILKHNKQFVCYDINCKKRNLIEDEKNKITCKKNCSEG